VVGGGNETANIFGLVFVKDPDFADYSLVTANDVITVEFSELSQTSYSGGVGELGPHIAGDRGEVPRH